MLSLCRAWELDDGQRTRRTAKEPTIAPKKNRSTRDAVDGARSTWLFSACVLLLLTTAGSLEAQPGQWPFSRTPEVSPPPLRRPKFGISPCIDEECAREGRQPFRRGRWGRRIETGPAGRTGCSAETCGPAAARALERGHKHGRCRGRR